MTRFLPTLMATTAFALACAVPMAPARAAGGYDGVWIIDVPASPSNGDESVPTCPGLRLQMRIDDNQVSGNFARVAPGEGNVVENGRGNVSAVSGNVQPDGAIATQWQNFHAEGRLIGSRGRLIMQSECGPTVATAKRVDDTQVATAASSDLTASETAATSSRRGNGYNVYFEFDKSTLTPEGREIVRSAVADHRTGISLLGKADLSGTDRYNMALSHRRADAVRDAMLAGGASGDHIDVRWDGDRKPPVPTAAGVRDAQNRVVEIAIQ